MALAKLLLAAALLLLCGVDNSYGAGAPQPHSQHLSLAAQHDGLFLTVDDGGADASSALRQRRPSGVYSQAGSISTPRQLWRTICKHTADFQVCRRELSAIGIPFFASPLDVVRLAVRAAADRAVKVAQHLASNGAAGHGELSKLEEQCANDCVELLSDVKDQMAMASSRLLQLDQKASVASLSDQLADVKVWLSASVSYQSACSDNFEVAPGLLQRQVSSSQAYLGRVFGVSLSLVDALSRLGNDIASWVAAPPADSPVAMSASQLNSGSQRHPFLYSSAMKSVLNDAVSDSIDGFFPVWVSMAQRKLLQASLSAISANAVVAKDGSGQFTTVTAAVNAIPKSRSGRYVIYIKQGTYNEVLNVTKDQKDVTFMGDGIGKTIITGDRNVASGDYNTYRTSTVGVSASGFHARDVTFRNTAGPSGHQAVALRAGADYMVLYRCSFEGYQDTLYALSSRQFYRDCQIYGTVDFIFGNAIAVFQNCALWARLPMKGQQNTYTAQGRELQADISGYSFQNCGVKADPALQNASYSVATYLGRPWKEYSRTVFMQSELQAVVDPAGWLSWNSSNPFQSTLYYGEYSNRGDGSGTSKRVTWKGVHSKMSASEASQFTVTNFIAGQSWIGSVDVPYQATL